MSFEYTVIPAPTRTKRQKGVKTAVERLAFALEDIINEMAADGWEYLRTETLTVEDKVGRFSKIVEKIETVLVFRRATKARPAHKVATQPEQVQAAPKVMAEPELQVKAPAAAKGFDDGATAPSLGGVSRD